MPIKIAFVGRAGTGKDTTMFALAKALKLLGKSLDYTPEIPHLGLYRGFELDKKTSTNSQLYLFGEQIAWEAMYAKSKHDYVLFNRSIIDVEVITRLNLPDKEWQIFENLCSYYMQTHPYDIIVHCSPIPQSKLVDKVRETDELYLAKQTDLFNHVLWCYNQAGHKVVYLGPQDLEARVKMLLNELQLS